MQPIYPGPRQLDFGEVLDLMFKLVGRSFGDLARIVLIVSAPLALASAVLSTATARITDDWADQSTRGVGEPSVEIEGDQVALLALLILAVLVVGWFAQQLAMAGSIRLLSESLEGRRVTWSDSLRFGWERLGSVLVVGVLVSFGTVLLALLCVVPGIVVWVGWLVSVPVLLLEGKKGTDALGRSWDLVKPRWWSTFGLVLLVTVGTSVAAGCASSVVGLGGVVGGPAGFVSRFAGSLVSNLITLPVMAALTVLIYTDLRWREYYRLGGTHTGPPTPGPQPGPWSTSPGFPPSDASAGWGAPPPPASGAPPPPTSGAPGWHPPPPPIE